MPRFIQPLLLLLARLTDRQLAAAVQYLKVENEVLRARLPKRITITTQERQRLLKFGRPLGPRVEDFVSIVTPRTFLRWLNGDRPRARSAAPARPPGRPRTADDLRDLVLRIARDTGWGYTRILGELKKIGLGTICRSTVVNILKDAGLDPGPKRGEHTWAEFLAVHAATLWQCDFFTHKALTWPAGGTASCSRSSTSAAVACSSLPAPASRTRPGSRSRPRRRRLSLGVRGPGGYDPVPGPGRQVCPAVR
jgi:putative transposase